MQHFELSHFDGFFHLLAEVGISFGLSKIVRRIYQDGIRTLYRSFNKNNEVQDQMETMIDVIEKSKIDNDIREELKTSIENIRISHRTSMIAVNRKMIGKLNAMEFKSMYLYAGLFSLKMLLLNGFQQFNINEGDLFVILLGFCMFAYLFYGFGFWSSFLNKSGPMSLSVAALFAVIINPLWAIVVALTKLGDSYQPSDSAWFVISIFIVSIPIIPFFCQLLKELQIQRAYRNDCMACSTAIQPSCDEIQTVYKYYIKKQFHIS